MSLGILTKFWMVTPVGKLEFNNKGEGIWEMYPTKGGTGTVKIKVEKKYPHTFDILREFGWPNCPEFKPYGMLYKDVSEPKKEDTEPVTLFSGMRKGNKVYGVARDGSAEIFIKQQGASNGQN